MPTPELVAEILEQFALDAGSSHGVCHWARVLENGRRLARATGADLAVVELFAVFHDARRENEYEDRRHGRRGGDLARAWWGDRFQLPSESMELLWAACAGHTGGRAHPSVTVMTCWDADRLDLGRVGIRTRADLLCTPQARERGLFDWAVGRATRREIPAETLAEWGVDEFGCRDGRGARS